MPIRRPLSARDILCALDDASEPVGLDHLCKSLQRRGCSARTIDVLWYLEELRDLSLAQISPYTESEQSELIKWLRHMAATLEEEETEADPAAPAKRFAITVHGRALLRVEYDAPG